MKKFNLSLIALFFIVIFAGCQIFTTSFTPQEDSGIQVSKITLSQTSVTLNGSRNAANQTVTATVSPSFAQDTTVYWETSDKNICGLSATTGSSVTLLLKGEGKATVTAKDYSSKVSSTIDVTCVFETTPPFAVSSVNATPHANNVFFTWTDPVDYDNDLDHIEIVASNGEKTSVAAGVQYGWVKNLTAGTEYSFTLTAYDANGNPSSAVSANATTTDSEDSTVPVAQTSLKISTNNGTSATFTWTCGTGTYQKVAVRAADSSALSLSAETSSNSKLSFVEENSSVIFDIPDNTTNSVTISGFETGKSYVLSLCELNADLLLSDSNEIDFTAAPAVSNVSAKLKYTGSIIVEWTDFNDSSYYYKATASSVSDPVKTIESSNIAYGTQNAYLTGLEVGTEYLVSVSTYSADNQKLASSEGVSITPGTVLWQIINTYNTSYLFAPYITDSLSNANICTVAAGSNWKYPYWIVKPSLSTPNDSSTFSLEASDANGIASNLYLCIDNVKTFPSGGDASGWSYPASSHPYHAYALEQLTIISDMKSLDYASFSLLPSSVETAIADGYSNWFVWKVGSTGYYLYDTYLNVSGESSYNASSGDYVFAYKETYIN